MSGFSASKASFILDTFFPFFLGEFFNADGIDVHGIWIDFGAWVVGVVSLDGVGVVGFLGGDGICAVPLRFEVDSTGIPIINLGGYSVHAIDSLHEGSRDSS